MKTKDKFAEKQLKKYGWKEGEGIGKTNQGIADPIKASFKFDTAGVGFNLADQFTINWWEHLYNNTATKINESNKSDDTNFKSTTEEIVTKEDKSSNPLTKKSFFYSRFQKGDMLVNGELQKLAGKNNNKDDDANKSTNTNLNDNIDLKELKKGKIVSDEELFKVCEGRTAHKGARHGIKMNGKLARIEEQEKLLLAKFSNKTNSNTEIINESSNKKRKSLKVDDINNVNGTINEEGQKSNDDVDDMSHVEKKKKKKKKKSSKDEYEYE